MASRGGGQGSTKIDKKTGNLVRHYIDRIVHIISCHLLDVEMYATISVSLYSLFFILDIL